MVTVPVPGVTLVTTGTPGVVLGVTADDGTDELPVPMALMAWTVKV